MQPTLDEVRREGLAALRERLGQAGMIRFLQLFDNGRGDYAKERREWVDRTSMDDFTKLIRRRKTSRKRNARKPASS